MAFTAVGALVAGETAVTATLVLSAVAEVGVAMTVVGAVTGSKDLMKIGGILGLVGGVGGMIAGGMSAAGGAAGVGEAGWGADLGAEALSGATADAAMGAAESGVVSSAVTPSAVSAEPLADLGVPTPNPTDMRIASGTQTTPSGTIASEMQAGPTVNDISTPSGPQGPQGPQAPSSPADNPLDQRLANGTATSPGNAPRTSGSFWKSFSDFANNNKTLFSGGMQLLGGAMKGASDASMWDQKMALEQQRLAQTSHGSEVANFAPRTGVINGARV